MNTLRNLAALVAAIALPLTAGALPASADEAPTPVVTTHDVDVTAEDCYDDIIRVSGLHSDSPEKHYWIVTTYGPDGMVPGGSLMWSSGIPQDLIMGFCSDDLPEGAYSVRVDGVEMGTFSAYRPDLEVVSVVPPEGSTARVAAKPRKPKFVAHRVTARLSIRGTALAGVPVTITNRYAGVDHVTTRGTDAAGQVRTICPRKRTCTVSFSYVSLAASSPVKVARR